MRVCVCARAPLFAAWGLEALWDEKYKEGGCGYKNKGQKREGVYVYVLEVMLRASLCGRGCPA